ncbi:hypothetical protein GJAV_G00106820 [Gymnothorax javanicus]|nr:hypothetical protein GJAV_G00106820 [Gymnothorax javanicus]
MAITRFEFKLIQGKARVCAGSQFQSLVKLGNHGAECKHCGTTISGSIKATSNFKRHLERKHAAIYTILNTPTAAPLLFKPVSAPTPPPSPSPTPSNLPTADTFTTGSDKWKSSDPHQKQLEKAIASMIAHDLLPLRFVNSKKFRAVMHLAEPRFSVPERKKLSSLVLSAVCSDVETKLKLQMHQAQDLCLTVDIWSSRDMRSFLGITGHFILDHTLHSIMVSCLRFKGSHSANRILTVYQETLAHFDIAEKVTHIITDNASNIVKAFTLPGMEDLATSEDEDVEEEEEEEDDLQEQPLPDELKHLQAQRSPCFAHTLQLVVKDGLKEAAAVQKVIKKVSKIVSHCRKSTKSSELLEGHTKLQLANATRWNSQVSMVQSLPKLPAATLDQIKANAEISLSAYELQLCTELVDILQPFQLATDFVQAPAARDESQPPPAKRSKLFTFMTARATPNRPPPATEVSKYLSQPCISEEDKPLEYWKKKDTFPILSSLACKYLCIPASSAPLLQWKDSSALQARCSGPRGAELVMSASISS